MMYCVPTYHQPPSRENFDPTKNYDCRNHNSPHENLVYIEPAVIILPYNRIHFYNILSIDHVRYAAVHADKIISPWSMADT